MRNSDVKTSPPFFAEKLLCLLADRFDLFSVKDDFRETYAHVFESRGRIRAWLWYWYQVIQLYGFHAANKSVWSIIMAKNYILIALRNMLRNKGYSAINITGLAVGIASCLLILSYVLDELSYDRFHDNADNIYRIATDAKMSGSQMTLATSAPKLGPTMLQEFPEVINQVRIFNRGHMAATYQDRHIEISDLIWSENSLFEVFSFKIAEGDPATILSIPFQLALTESEAIRIFGSENPIGKVLRNSEQEEYIISGILADPPENSHIQYKAIASLETLNRITQQGLDTWGGWNYYTYFLLADGTDHRQLESKFNGFKEKHLKELLEMTNAEMNPFLQPLTDIYLHSKLYAELSVNGDFAYVLIFSAIAVFILIIACINFMNLSTARSAKRAKEVGMRKVLGAYRSQVAKQFYGETVVYSLLAMIVAIILSQIVLPYFNSLSGKNIKIDFFSSPEYLIALAGIVLFTGLAAGSYPAMLLSRFHPAAILKGVRKKETGGSVFRGILVVIQFSISIGLITGTLVIIEQTDYMRDKNLGFDKEHLLTLVLRTDEARNSAQNLKEEFSKLEGVNGASLSNAVPARVSFGADAYYPEGFAENESIFMSQLIIDADFIDLYDIEIVAGRGFSEEFPTDRSESVLINETAAKKLGWTDPVGKTIGTINDPVDLRSRVYQTVIGVVKDFNYISLHREIEPMHISNYEYWYYVSLKLESGNISGTISAIEEKWNEILPDLEFDYRFIDDRLEMLYRSEDRLGSVFRAFASLAVLIGCLGLFGLSSYIAEQRTKEIGIRKVLGSSEGSIIVLLCREFAKLLLIANAIAWPAAWFGSGKWIERFAYQTSIEIWPFLIAGITAFGIAVLTVSYQAVKAARTNPAISLKHE